MQNFIIALVAVHVMMMFTYQLSKKDTLQTYHNVAEIIQADKSMRPCNAND